MASYTHPHPHWVRNDSSLKRRSFFLIRMLLPSNNVAQLSPTIGLRLMTHLRRGPTQFQEDQPSASLEGHRLLPLIIAFRKNRDCRAQRARRSYYRRTVSSLNLNSLDSHRKCWCERKRRTKIEAIFQDVAVERERIRRERLLTMKANIEVVLFTRSLSFHRGRSNVTLQIGVFIFFTHPPSLWEVVTLIREDF